MKKYNLPTAATAAHSTKTAPQAAKRPPIAATKSTNTTAPSVKGEFNSPIETATYTDLLHKFNDASHAYYVESKPIMTDEEFDALVDRIKQMQKSCPQLVTQYGDPLATIYPDNSKGFAKVSHAIPMLSTAKVKKVDDLVKWMQKTAKKTGDDLFTIEWKYDGLSCSLVYEDGQLVRAATRGDGDTGDDVTAHARLMPTIPNEIPLKGRVEVRGEVVMPFAAFDKWNSEHPNDRLANPRNAASGSLKSLDPNVVVERGLEFYAYDLMLGNDVPFTIIGTGLSATNNLRAAEEHFTALSALLSLGFKSHDHDLTALNWNDVENIVRIREEQRSQLPVAVDGLVIKINNTTKREMLGRTEHHPHYLVAYKFGAPTYETVLRNVEYTIGEKTGKRTPVAHFDPVTINGATITKASCGSMATLEKKNIQIGDRILVCLSNDVIPQVVGKA